jgi:hypothetical protein
MDKEINPRVEDYDFFCSREKCPSYNKSTWEQYEPSTCKRDGKSGLYCIIGYRLEVIKLRAMLEKGE